MDAIEPRPGVGIQTGTCAAPYLFVGWTDINYFCHVKVSNPKDLFDVFGQLAEPFLTFSQRLLRLRALGYFNPKFFICRFKLFGAFLNKVFQTVAVNLKLPLRFLSCD